MPAASPRATTCLGDLARRLVDHLALVHDGALALDVGGVVVGVEQPPGGLELLGRGHEHLVGDVHLARVQHPLAVEADQPGAVAQAPVLVDVLDVRVRAVDRLQPVRAGGGDDLREHVVPLVARVVGVDRPDHELGHADRCRVVARAEDDRLDAGRWPWRSRAGSRCRGRSRSGPRCRSGGSIPCCVSSWVSRWSTKCSCAASSTFGIMRQSRFAPAPPTTADDVAQAPLGGDAVHAHDAGLARVVVRVAAPARPWRASPPSRAARRRPRGRGRPGRRAASPPWPASSRMSPAPPGRNGATARGALLVSGSRSLPARVRTEASEQADAAERPVAHAGDADHAGARLEAPHARVVRDDAVVAEHEVVARRDRLLGAGRSSACRACRARAAGRPACPCP